MILSPKRSHSGDWDVDTSFDGDTIQPITLADLFLPPTGPLSDLTLSHWHSEESKSSPGGHEAIGIKQSKMRRAKRCSKRLWVFSPRWELLPGLPASPGLCEWKSGVRSLTLMRKRTLMGKNITSLFLVKVKFSISFMYEYRPQTPARPVTFA